MTHKFIDIRPFYFFNISTTMDQIELALKELKIQDNPNILAVSKSYNINYSTLYRRYHGIHGNALDAHQNQGLLTFQQERCPIEYINKLSERALHPTPAVIRNFVYEIARKEPGKDWTRRFVKRQENELLSRYLVPLDSARYKAQSKQEFMK